MFKLYTVSHLLFTDLNLLTWLKGTATHKDDHFSTLTDQPSSNKKDGKILFSNIDLFLTFYLSVFFFPLSFYMWEIKAIIKCWIKSASFHLLADPFSSRITHSLRRLILATERVLVHARWVQDWPEVDRHLQRPGGEMPLCPCQSAVDLMTGEPTCPSHTGCDSRLLPTADLRRSSR